MSRALDPDVFFDLFLRDADAGADRRIPRMPPLAQWRQWWAEAAELDPRSADLGFVLTGAELAERGIGRSHVRTSVRRGRWQAAGRGLVSTVAVERDLPEHGAASVLARRCHALSAAGASRLRPAAAIAGRSAAISHGLPTLRVPQRPELLTVREVGAGKRASAHLFTAALDPSETTTWFGRPLTTIERTLVDLGRHDRFDAIMAADAALHEELVTVVKLASAIDHATGWPGIRQARAVLATADGLAESALESVTRLRILDAGLPAPELQVWIAGYRVDFYWAKWRLILEADGRVKYTSDERWAEKKREQALRRYRGHWVERVTWDDVMGGWATTEHTLRALMR